MLSDPSRRLQFIECVMGNRHGLAALDPQRRQAIARLGGLAAHQQGVAHQWTHDEAIQAGRKGGLARQKKWRQAIVQRAGLPAKGE